MKEAIQKKGQDPGEKNEGRSDLFQGTSLPVSQSLTSRERYSGKPVSETSGRPERKLEPPERARRPDNDTQTSLLSQAPPAPPGSSEPFINIQSIFQAGQPGTFAAQRIEGILGVFFLRF